MPEFLGLRPGIPVLPAGSHDTPPFREGVHELGGGFVVAALGLFQRLERGAGEGVEGVPEALDDLVLFVRREQRLRPGPRRPAGSGVRPAGCWARVWSYVSGDRFRSA
ncbi:hypothetical protein [Streptomyces sp. AC550_RSS872]|uniref:hypothetical protein n=1 Tax=Streptomyces sp. AC550_RSS872 TaxID=2823689 RepID=UPI0020B8F935|nr:hypothetical protein [Streptomyces sp. AC550_RSS872]